MQKLIVPTEIQSLIDSIEATELNLGSFKIHKHPLLASGLDRHIHIKKISIDLNLPRTYIWYKQIVKDKEGKVLESNLPTPDWVILENEMSTLRNEKFERVMLPIVGEDTEEQAKYEKGNLMYGPVEVNSHKYLLWLLNNNKVGFIDLLNQYFQELLSNDEFRNQLDQLS